MDDQLEYIKTSDFKGGTGSGYSILCPQNT